MNSKALGEVEEEKDLGICITADLKPSKQCRVAYNKAVRILGMINRTIKYKNRQTLVALYKSLVRPLVEYCTPAWSPYYVKDKELLERVQHRFSRMVPWMRTLAYEERLEELRIWALELEAEKQGGSH